MVGVKKIKIGSRSGIYQLKILAGVACFLTTLGVARAIQPVVAVHDSEFTRTLLTTPASGVTPVGGATGFQWWPTNWAYFVMPESLKEACRSDGTPFVSVSDANIISGSLIDVDGTPRYPIVFSLASEAVGANEIAPLTNYVAAGGFLFVGSSSFTRNTNGTTRNNFAFATELGVNMTVPGLTNWRAVTNVQKFGQHRLLSHVPNGRISWLMPFSAEDIPYGPAPDNVINPSNGINFKHLVWRVTPTTATVLMSNDISADLLVKKFGKGYFIYYAPMQPLIGHGGEDSGMHAYMIFRKAMEWAFESSQLSIPRLSAWPYPYDAALEVRHDLEAIPGIINQCETSAQYEKSLNLKGDYYPSTGQVRENYSAGARAAAIASFRSAVTNYDATIGSHNGGLSNPYTASAPSDYWYWHWSPDEVLSVTVPGYPSGKTYGFISVSNSFQDIRGWLAGITNNSRNHWVAPAYNSTREGSREILDGLCKTVGEVKLTPFPHWTLSTKTSGKRFNILSIPLSDWYTGPMVAHSLESGHTVDTIRESIDFYYNLGALINSYSHSSSAGNPPPADATWLRNDLAKEYCDYATDTNRFPRMWAVNSEILYDWWRSRSNATVRASFTTNGLEYRASVLVSNAVHSQTAVEVWVPRPAYTNLQVFTNSTLAGATVYRTLGQTIRVRSGNNVTNVQVRFTVVPEARHDLYSFGAVGPRTVAAPGILTNDAPGLGTNLSARLVAGPAHGLLTFSTNGGFTYTATNGFVGIDNFTYRAVDGVSTSGVATVSLAAVSSSGVQYTENFTRGAYPATLGPPWVTSNTWTIVGAELRSTNGPTDYGFAYIGASWTNYSVEARLRFPSGPNVPGAGIFGRLNPNTGARYALWLYPENTPFGSPNVLRLIKFTGWTTWSGIAMQEIDVTSEGFPGVGTNWHALKLSFSGNQITASYEGDILFTVTDNSFDGVPAYLSGGIGIETYKEPSRYTLSVDDVVVNASTGPPPVNPQAANDAYEFLAGAASTVNAPGVLINDETGDGGGLVAQLANGPSHHNGAFTLEGDGSFDYTPTAGYSGPDSFTYRVFDGLNLSAAATVNLSVLPATNVAFFDNFTRTNTTAFLSAPWAASNRWRFIGGQLVSLSNSVAQQNYAFAIINSNWTDFEVETQIRFPDELSGGGGLGGRLNVNTGARYSVWVYPDNSPWVTQAMELFKWTDWTNFSSLGFLPLPQPVGTGPHTLKLVFQTNRISVYYDGVLRISTNDNTYASGAVDVETYEDPLHYAMLADYIKVSLLSSSPLAADDSYVMNEDSVLSVARPGVLANDHAGPGGGPLTATLLTNVTQGTLVLTNNGGFLYTPTGNFFGTDTFVYRASDAATNSSPAFVTLTVNPVNDAPTLTLASNTVIVPRDSGAVSVPNFAALSVGPANESSQSISNVVVLGDSNPGLFSVLPAVSTSGTLTFTPAASTEGSAVVMLQARDNGSTLHPSTNGSVAQAFTITVAAANTPPTLPVQTNRVVEVQTTLTVTNTGSDAETPTGQLLYSLNGPAGAQINSQGVITWTPAPAQAPTTNLFTTTVTDNGVPALSATNIFTVFVTGPEIPLYLRDVVITNDLATVTWDAVAGKRYRLQFMDSVDSSMWVNVVPDVTASDNSAWQTNSLNGSPQRFFRVFLVWP